MSIKLVNICVDVTFLMEIMDQRCWLNRRGHSTRKLDAVLETEIRELSSHFLPAMPTDDGNVLFEYAPSRRLLGVLAACEAVARSR